MKILFIFMIFLCSPSFSNVESEFFISSHLQCTSELARKNYRELFVSITSGVPNDWNVIPSDGSQKQSFSSMVDICIRKTEVSQVKSFMAHLFLKHISDARIASDGLGKGASDVFYSLNQRKFASDHKNANDLVSPSSTGSAILAPNITRGTISGMLMDDQVNWERPNFDVALSRLLFLRYGFYKKGSQPDLPPASVQSFLNVKLLTPTASSWEEIKTTIPHVAYMLEKTISKMIDKKQVLEQQKPSLNSLHLFASVSK